MSKPKGRTSKFTPDVCQSIVEYLQDGATVKAACDRVGVGESTYYEWLEIGAAHTNNAPHRRMPRHRETRQAYADFAESVSRAIAGAMIRATVSLRKGMSASKSISVTTETSEETRLDKEGKPYQYRKTTTRRTVTTMPGDWRAGLEYLQRRDPDNWARTLPQKIEHTGRDGGPIELAWRDTAVAMIQRGELTRDQALEAFDHDDTLVADLFARAAARVSTRQG